MSEIEERERETDPSDRATQRELEINADALAEIARKPAMPFKGKCYNCEAPIKRGCFCDADCRDDFEFRLKQKNRRL